MKLSPTFWAWPLLLGALAACQNEEVTREGYRPIYLSRQEATRVFASPARPLRQTGKIYTIGRWVLVNELYQGIHIIDNTNPSQPERVGFINIPGNVDMAVKGTQLYADNYTDLITLDISDPSNIRVMSRLENVLPQGNWTFPNQTDVVFECPDPAKGVVAGWEKAMLTNPRCRR
ncbi:MAG: hypothetical protein MUC97_06950 [Bernardetiaceae bacterium]|jgi:hypothetical protein|nr:hypothetical protein [Bernardetiaceae bacterium]